MAIPESDPPPKISVAILAAEPALCDRLEMLVAESAALSLVGSVETVDALARLFDHERVDLVLGDPAPARMDPGDRSRAASVALIDAAAPERALDALQAGATAILPRSAGRAEILAAIGAAMQGLSVLPAELLRTLLAASDAPAATALDRSGPPGPELTQRELDVLTALADGASNKAIARRLNISFHTVKFHVASILAKLDAESRTEAVAQAARRGLVML
jgi:two-component system, NarL family, response regulator YdfI